MTDREELVELKRRMSALELKNLNLKSAIIDLLSSDIILAGVAVSLAGDRVADARKGLDELRETQVAAYEKLAGNE